MTTPAIQDELDQAWQSFADMIHQQLAMALHRKTTSPDLTMRDIAAICHALDVECGIDFRLKTEAAE